MKRLFTFYVTFCMAGAFLFGCGNNPSSPAAAASVATSESGIGQVDETTADQSVEAAEVPEVTLYFIRHGKTFFNTTGQFQGFCDSQLTEKGIEQAIKVGKGMSDIQFSAAYSSDLGRQRNTAKLILNENSHDIPQLEELYGLREWNYGSFEGRDEAEVCKPMFDKYGYEMDEDWTQWDALVKMLGNKGLADEYASMDPTGLAESFDEIIARAQEAMDTIVEESIARGGGNVLIVSSGSQIPTILEMVAPDQYNKDAELKNCSVSILKYKDGQYQIEILGDTSYLDAN